MASTFLGLNTTKSGLNYYQSALNTTAHNISNAKTEGYSRQEVVSKASSALRLYNQAGMMGTGVSVEGIQQIRNPYYDVKYWNGSALQGEYTSKFDYSYEMELYFNEMNSPTGYTALLTELQNAMQDLADDPSNATTRVQYLNDFQSYTQLFNEIGTNLQLTQRSINDEIAVRVDEINTIAKQIFSLNDQIKNVELRGGNANDLRDQRLVFVDQLSEIVNLTTEETPIIASDGHDSGATRYIVRINGETLVDDMQCRQLIAVPRDEKVNETDVDGLYDLAWKNLDGTPGDAFSVSDKDLSGKLAGLFEVRDGNNKYGFESKTKQVGMDVDGTFVTVETTRPFYMSDINIPQSGKIRINSVDYYYDRFEAEYNPDTGEITNYTFYGLKKLSPDGKTKVMANPADLGLNLTAKIGESVDFEGVPYYMRKLNEFVRVFSRHINDLCVSGVDAYGNPGEDLLSLVDENGQPMKLSDTVANTRFASNGDSYYRLNVLTWDVNDTIMKDPQRVVVSYEEDIKQGNIEKCDILKKIQESMTDTSIFKQGSPSQYLESIISTLGVQTRKCNISQKHQSNIVYRIGQQRLSESSVDTNEEASNLIIQQNGYNLSCKVMSVLDEIYNKLINETGV